MNLNEKHVNLIESNANLNAQIMNLYFRIARLGQINLFRLNGFERLRNWPGKSMFSLLFCSLKFFFSIFLILILFSSFRPDVDQIWTFN